MSTFFKVALPLLLIALVMVACSERNSDQSEVESLVKDFISKQYDLKHDSIPENDLSVIEEQNKKLKPYVTGAVWNKLKANGETAIPVRIAEKNQADIEAAVSNITIDKTKDVKNSYELKYEITVKLIDKNKEVKEVKVPAESTVIKSDDKWVISRIWSNKGELSVLVQ